MSIHKSLRSRNVLKRSRNVLNRGERIEILLDRGLWKEGDKVMGLPKVRTFHKAKKKPKKEAAPADAAAAAAAPKAEE